MVFKKKKYPLASTAFDRKDISVKKYIFDDPFHQKGSVLVILVPGISKFFDEILRVMVRLMRLQRLMSLIRPQRF